MSERARRIMSFVLAAIAVFSVGRVILAYASRPSRLSTRFALPVADLARDDAVERDAGSDVAPSTYAGASDFTLLSGKRDQMLAAIVTGDATAYARNFSSESISLTASGHSIVGHAAIEEAVGRTLARANVLDAGIIVGERRRLGSQVFEEGGYHISLRVDKAEIRHRGRYVALWKRELGEWRIVFEAVRADISEFVEA